MVVFLHLCHSKKGHICHPVRLKGGKKKKKVSRTKRNVSNFFLFRRARVDVRMAIACCFGLLGLFSLNR